MISQDHNSFFVALPYLNIIVRQFATKLLERHSSTLSPLGPRIMNIGSNIFNTALLIICGVVFSWVVVVVPEMLPANQCNSQQLIMASIDNLHDRASGRVYGVWKELGTR